MKSVEIIDSMHSYYISINASMIVHSFSVDSMKYCVPEAIHIFVQYLKSILRYATPT